MVWDGGGWWGGWLGHPSIRLDWDFVRRPVPGCLFLSHKNPHRLKASCDSECSLATIFQDLHVCLHGLHRAGVRQNRCLFCQQVLGDVQARENHERCFTRVVTQWKLYTQDLLSLLGTLRLRINGGISQNLQGNQLQIRHMSCEESKARQPTL